MADFADLADLPDFADLADLADLADFADLAPAFGAVAFLAPAPVAPGFGAAAFSAPLPVAPFLAGAFLAAFRVPASFSAVAVRVGRTVSGRAFLAPDLVVLGEVVADADFFVAFRGAGRAGPVALGPVEARVARGLAVAGGDALPVAAVPALEELVRAREATRPTTTSDPIEGLIVDCSPPDHSTRNRPPLTPTTTPSRGAWPTRFEGI